MDAIIYPWTMVIHLQNAYLTRGTMVSSIRFYMLTFHAIPKISVNLKNKNGDID